MLWMQYLTQAAFLRHVRKHKKYSLRVARKLQKEAEQAADKAQKQLELAEELVKACLNLRSVEIYKGVPLDIDEIDRRNHPDKSYRYYKYDVHPLFDRPNPKKRDEQYHRWAHIHMNAQSQDGVRLVFKHRREMPENPFGYFGECYWGGTWSWDALPELQKAAKEWVVLGTLPEEVRKEIKRPMYANTR